MTDWQTIDFFNDQSLVEDPYPYFDQLRAECPVLQLPHLGVVAVTGYDEAMDVYRDTDTFSSCNSVVGPFAQFPVPLEGDDVSDIVDRHRDLVAAMGLPTTYRGDWDRLQSVMRVDKKARGASLRFVVLDGIGAPGILTDPDQAWLDAAWAAVSDEGTTR